MKVRLRGNIGNDRGNGYVSSVHLQRLSNGLVAGEITFGCTLGKHDRVNIAKRRFGISFDKRNGKDIKEAAVNPPYFSLGYFIITIFNEYCSSPVGMNAG